MKFHRVSLSLPLFSASSALCFLVIMFCRIKLCLNNSSDDFRICQMCFRNSNIFICIYKAINCKINGRFTPVLKFFKLWNNLNGSSSSDWLRAWLSELTPAFMKHFNNVIGETHFQAAVSKVMASNMLTFVGDFPPSMLAI